MAQVLNFFNDLFDSVNGYTKNFDSSLRVIVSDNSVHHKFWASAITQLKRMRYVDSLSKKPINRSLCLQNWVKTIYSFQNLWKMLRNEGFKRFTPRYINQDPLENFFGCIRMAGCRNINPTCVGMRGAYKVSLINNLSSRYSVGRNCEEICNGELLFTLEQFISDRHRENINTAEIEEECAIPNISSTIEEQSSLSYEKTCSIIATIKKKILLRTPFKQCNLCQDIASKNNEFGKQIYPRMQKIINQNINNFYYQYKIKEKIRDVVLAKIDFNFIKCEQHHEALKNCIIDFLIITRINIWCKIINRMLNGKDSIINKNPIMRQAQLKYIKSRKKK